MLILKFSAYDKERKVMNMMEIVNNVIIRDILCNSNIQNLLII